MTLKVVPINDGPSLRDVVAQIRAFADRIEAGDYGEVSAVFALMPCENDYPRFWGWGDISGINDPVVQIELAKIWLLTNLVKRD